MKSKDSEKLSFESSKPLLDSAFFVFSQKGNTLGTTDDYENLTIRLETQLPGDDPFIVLKTEGWSLDSIDELQELIEKCLRIFQK